MYICLSFPVLVFSFHFFAIFFPNNLQARKLSSERIMAAAVGRQGLKKLKAQAIEKPAWKGGVISCKHTHTHTHTHTQIKKKKKSQIQKTSFFLPFLFCFEMDERVCSQFM